jgi:hypothetical protein
MDDSDISQYVKNRLNINLAKVLAFVLILFMCVYHGYLNIFTSMAFVVFCSEDYFFCSKIKKSYICQGNNSCSRLLGAGHIQGDREWQPLGCMIHNYTKT